MIDVRKKVIANSEWVVTIQLEIDGRNSGQPLELRYTDSYLAANPDTTGWLLASALTERALKLHPRKGRK